MLRSNCPLQGGSVGAVNINYDPRQPSRRTVVPLTALELERAAPVCAVFRCWNPAAADSLELPLSQRESGRFLIASLRVVESSELCRIHQVVQRHANCVRQGFSVIDRDIDRSSLDPAQVGPRNSGVES